MILYLAIYQSLRWHYSCVNIYQLVVKYTFIILDDIIILTEERVYSEGIKMKLKASDINCISYCPLQRQFTEGCIYLTYGSIGIRIHHGREALWQRWPEAEHSHLQVCAGRRESELEVEQGYALSKPVPSDLLPPARPHILNLHK